MSKIFGKKEIEIVESKLTDYLAPRLLAAEKDAEKEEEKLEVLDTAGAEEVDKDEEVAEEISISPEDVEEVIEDKVPEESGDVDAIAEEVAGDIAGAVADVATAIDVPEEEAKDVIVEVLSGEETGEEIITAAKKLVAQRKKTAK